MKHKTFSFSHILKYENLRRSRLFYKSLRLSGIMWLTVSTMLFYNHLYTAARNPGFFVVVYFDHFGEGLLELILFSAFIPFIIYVLYDELKRFTKWQP